MNDQDEPLDELARVLCVGGTDPTGAAGLGADIRAVTAAGAYASLAVTAVTVQTSSGVTEVMPTPASVVGAQMDAALGEPGATVIKTGMLVHEDIVRAVLQRCLRAPSVGLVIDPVVRATSGRRLLEEGGLALLEGELLPRAALVTPNLPELELLVGVVGQDRSAMERGADLLLLRGASAVLVKGGHAVDSDGQVHDLFRTADGDGAWLTRPRRPGLFRGTGCALAAAIAARLAQGLRLRDALEGARDQVERAMALGIPQPGRPTLLGTGRSST